MMLRKMGTVEDPNLERTFYIFFLVMCVELLLCFITIPSGVNTFILMFLHLFLPGCFILYSVNFPGLN